MGARPIDIYLHGAVFVVVDWKLCCVCGWSLCIVACVIEVI